MSKNDGFLTTRGKQIFDQVKAHLKQNNILSECDDMMIESFAFWRQVFETHAAKCIHETSQESKTGWRQITSDFSVTQKATDMLIKLSRPLGLTYTDRLELFGDENKKKPKYG